MQQLVVTAAIIERGNEILIAQRNVGASQGLLWEFPGGKVRFGEDPRACLAREIREELGAAIEVGPLFTVASHVYDGDRHIILIVYRCRLLSGEPRPLACRAIAWINPAQLPEFELAAADRIVAAAYLAEEGVDDAPPDPR